MRPTPRPARPGSVLPVLVVCLVGLFSFVALAVDLGMVAVSKTQCQNAADIAALVGCRNLDNKRPDDAAYDNNRTAALTAARAAVSASPLMRGQVPTSDTNPAVRAGVYDYNTGTQRFAVSYPASPGAGRSWTALEVNLTASQPTYFMKLWGVSGMPTGARAVAVHRPRDVAFALDMTGSMGYASTFNYNNQSLNPDPLAPSFGHYVSVQSKLIATANQANGSGEAISRNNFTVTTPGGPPIVRDFVFVVDAANQADPSVAAYPLPADRSVVRNAFHRWSPPETPGDPTNYVSQTYDFSGYNAYHTGAEASPRGPTPAPGTFGTMTDGGGITYVGDRWRRANGAVNKTDATWATGAATTKLAGNAIELLGYNVNSGNVRGGTSGGSTITTEDKFRDAVWEQYGYDLDVVKYRTDKGTGGPLNPLTYVPTLVPAADRYQGFSMGPGYWGKTFYTWPPDPRAPVGNPGDALYQAGDWRRRYFLRMNTATATKTGGTTTVNNVAAGAMDPQADANPYTTGAGNVEGINEVLFGSTQTLAGITSSQSIPTTDTGTGTTTNVSQTVQNYQINYPAVLRWVKSGPQVLPPNLRAGRVLYYSSIPSDVDASTGTAQQKLDKLFWKNYIEYVLGVGSYTSAGFLYGAGDSWTAQVRSLTTSDMATWTGPTGTWAAVKPYMRYSDSPQRPRLHSWFGPLSMMDFLGVQSNWNPGTCHEAQCWQLKAGMNSVLDDIRNNHPNDSVGMTMFSYSAYQNIRVAQGQDFLALKNALFYPKSLLTTIRAGDLTSEVRPYTSSWGSVSMDEVPNANGATDPNTGLMLAFNLLSPSANLPTNYGTVKGRRGASKIVIFETDGVPNSYSNFTLNLKGYDTYYSGIAAGGSPGNGDATSMARAVAVVQQIVKPMATANGTGTDSGLSLPSARAKVYPIGFGDLFDPVASPSATFRPTALQFLANIGIAGGTVSAGATGPPANQIITGSYANRISTLRTCLQQIFQSGVSVTLIE